MKSVLRRVAFEQVRRAIADEFAARRGRPASGCARCTRDRPATSAARPPRPSRPTRRRSATGTTASRGSATRALTLEALLHRRVHRRGRGSSSSLTTSAAGGGAPSLQIMYGIGGEHDLSERVLGPPARVARPGAGARRQRRRGTRSSSTSTASCSNMVHVLPSSSSARLHPEIQTFVSEARRHRGPALAREGLGGIRRSRGAPQRAWRWPPRRDRIWRCSCRRSGSQPPGHGYGGIRRPATVRRRLQAPWLDCHQRGASECDRERCRRQCVHHIVPTRQGAVFTSNATRPVAISVNCDDGAAGRRISRAATSAS